MQRGPGGKKTLRFFISIDTLAYFHARQNSVVRKIAEVGHLSQHKFLNPKLSITPINP